jgi:hypothetical protein
MKYQETFHYKGLMNVSVQKYATNLFVLNPQQAVILEADVADKVVENAGVTVAFLNQEFVDRCVERGFPECKEVFNVEPAMADMGEGAPPFLGNGGVSLSGKSPQYQLVWNGRPRTGLFWRVPIKEISAKKNSMRSPRTQKNAEKKGPTLNKK